MPAKMMTICIGSKCHELTFRVNLPVQGRIQEFALRGRPPPSSSLLSSLPIPSPVFLTSSLEVGPLKASRGSGGL